jgi:hypothetical protein
MALDSEAFDKIRVVNSESGNEGLTAVIDE